MKKRIKKSDIDVEFPGFCHYTAIDQFFMYPEELVLWWWALSGSEQKILDFILRKTFGWQQQGDRIAHSQIVEATGLSRTQVKESLKSLERKKFIKIQRRYRKPSYIELPLMEGALKLGEMSKGQLSMFQKRMNEEYKRDLYNSKGYK
jgi:phage replication O-like protein O